MSGLKNVIQPDGNDLFSNILDPIVILILVVLDLYTRNYIDAIYTSKHMIIFEGHLFSSTDLYLSFVTINTCSL